MDELEKVQAQIRDLQQKADALLNEKRASVLSEVRAKIQAYGFTAKDLRLTVGDFPVSPSKGIPVAAKYRLGDQTWTGRGRQPKFIADFLESGGNLDEILIK